MHYVLTIHWPRIHILELGSGLKENHPLEDEDEVSHYYCTGQKLGTKPPPLSVSILGGGEEPTNA